MSILPRVLFEAKRPGIALVVGWLCAFLPSLLLGALVGQLFPTLGQPDLPMKSETALILVAVVSPILETLIMAAVLWLLVRWLPPTIAVLISSVGWGIAHSLAAPAWGLVIWWPFLIFSILYVTWRQRSLLAALAMPAAVHGLQNLLPALLMYSGARI